MDNLRERVTNRRWHNTDKRRANACQSYIHTSLVEERYLSLWNDSEIATYSNHRINYQRKDFDQATELEQSSQSCSQQKEGTRLSKNVCKKLLSQARSLNTYQVLHTSSFWHTLNSVGAEFIPSFFIVPLVALTDVGFLSLCLINNFFI